MTEPATGTAFDRATFTPALPEEIATLVAIDRGSPQPWTFSAFESELRNAPPTLFTLRRESGVIGFVVARFHPPDMDIVNVAVAKEHRRRGFGNLLLRLLLEKARIEGVERVFLEVRESNTEARGLYLRSGFEETQRRRNFYKDPVEDALLMTLTIEP